MAKAWYVVHTYSGYEKKAKDGLELRIAANDAQDRFGDILIPADTGVEIRNGKKRQVTRRWFPGYILVEVELDNETWHIVKNTPKITGFVGGSRNPPPVPDHEMVSIKANFAGEEEVGEETALTEFDIKEEVRVIAGAFSNMKGVVEEVFANRARLKVTVNIFGRSTSLELDFTEVEKL
jgi:transcriptional antiterminator NusG